MAAPERQFDVLPLPEHDALGLAAIESALLAGAVILRGMHADGAVYNDRGLDDMFDDDAAKFPLENAAERLPSLPRLPGWGEFSDLLAGAMLRATLTPIDPSEKHVLPHQDRWLGEPIGELISGFSLGAPCPSNPPVYFAASDRPRFQLYPDGAVNNASAPIYVGGYSSTDLLLIRQGMTVVRCEQVEELEPTWHAGVHSLYHRSFVSVDLLIDVIELPTGE